MRDILLKNGRLYDQHKASFFSGNLAISDGRIVSEYLLCSPKIIDCSDQFILPAFRDAHIHFSHWIQFRNFVNLADCSTNQLIEILKNHAHEKVIFACQWVPDFNLTEKLNYRTKLDKISYSPIVIYSKDLHSAWLNTAAFEQLGWLDYSENEAERIIRDESGKPTGIVQEIAVQEIAKIGENLPRFSESDFEKAQMDCLKNGITSVISVEDEEGILLLDRQNLKIKIEYFLYDRYLEKIENGWKPPQSENIKFAGMKLFLDGSFGSSTAWLTEPYEKTNNCGVSLYSKTELREKVRRVHKLGLPVMIHAIGDKAGNLATRILLEESVGLPDRIEHFQIANQDDFDKLTNSGITIGMQPSHLFHDKEKAEKTLGRKRMWHCYPVRSFSARTKVQFGSDAPVVPINPMLNLSACENIWNPAERISRSDALALSTENGSLVLKENDVANITIWEQSLFDLPAEKLLNCTPEKTILSGEIVWTK
ncbi:MAG: amidohydrolase family protein [Candidatus Marinimicrobia bacterium]|nr:amidohydrolase family protein [Candidatus Neomarinimicrobiota bacterium]